MESKDKVTINYSVMFPGAKIPELNDVAKNELDRIVRLAQEKNILEQIDFGLFINYSFAYQRILEIKKTVDAIPLDERFIAIKSGYLQTHPSLNAEQKAQTIFKQATSELIKEFKRNIKDKSIEDEIEDEELTNLLNPGTKDDSPR